MGRGRGKGKRGGRGGGGRQHFVSSLEELESRNDRDEAWAARRKAERDADNSEEGSSSSGGEGKCVWFVTQAGGHGRWLGVIALKVVLLCEHVDTVLVQRRSD